MNPIEKQRQLIDQLYHLVHESAESGYETASCRFEYFVSKDDGSSSVGARFSYEINGETKNAVLAYPGRNILNAVIPELHAEMKAHTGGDWETFTLAIERDGMVRTKFDYPEDPPVS